MPDEADHRDAMGEQAVPDTAVPDTAVPDTGELDPPVLEIAPTPTGLRVEGELDLATAPVLAAHLDPLPTWCHDVVIDVAGLRFVDSTGLGVLLRAHHVARDEGRRLLLASPSDRLRRLLEISALENVLLVADVDDAADEDDAAGDGTADVIV